MANGLAMAAYRADVCRGQMLLCQERVDALRGQFDPVVFRDCTASHFILAAGAQAKQLATQSLRHGDVMSSA